MMAEWLMFNYMFLLGCLGAWVHFLVKKYKKKEIDCTFMEYLGNDTPSTFLTLGAIMASEWMFLSSSPFLTMETFFSVNTVGTAIIAGYSSDSFFNKQV